MRIRTLFKCKEEWVWDETSTTRAKAMKLLVPFLGEYETHLFGYNFDGYSTDDSCPAVDVWVYKFPEYRFIFDTNEHIEDEDFETQLSFELNGVYELTHDNHRWSGVFTPEGIPELVKQLQSLHLQ
jgi:hypothetical protein